MEQVPFSATTTSALQKEKRDYVQPLFKAVVETKWKQKSWSEEAARCSGSSLPSKAAPKDHQASSIGDKSRRSKNRSSVDIVEDTVLTRPGYSNDGHVVAKEMLSIELFERGQCPSCGLQMHDVVKQGFRRANLVPLSNKHVLSGRCHIKSTVTSDHGYYNKFLAYVQPDGMVLVNNNNPNSLHTKVSQSVILDESSSLQDKSIGIVVVSSTEEPPPDKALVPITSSNRPRHPSSILCNVHVRFVFSHCYRQ